MAKFNKYYPDEFEKLRNAGKISSQCLDFISDKIKPGVKTQEIDDLCVNFLKKNKAVSAPLFYKGFPKSICTSVNHVVCHGIPSEKILKEGDIVNVDITSFVDGFHGDTSRTFCVGKVSVKAKNLVETTKEALDRSIEILKPGICLGDIGYEIQNFVEKKGYSVVRDFCGHGVGRNFHEEPNILHYGKKGTGPKLEEGMVFTIEPMINAGKYETKLLNDGWTAVTKDKSLSAQFEHTVGITNNGYEIFTLS
ncbi:MAG: type I methionyl aminopeptidase [Pelagibacteraceae bacterium]|jgi:methionyl aminopeptidase|nr:type I methionyl aminopeptidase [Pelagibacteraceae bacterium]MCI5079344.1 type I methionyl aminopeptidase [Pelagibacteraceae bacterium]